MLYLPSSVSAASENFEVLPRVCISDTSEPCLLNAKVSWHTQEPVCLSLLSKLDQPLFCGNDANEFSIQLAINSNITLVLVSSDNQHIIAGREIKRLQPINNQLHQRRLNWSLF